MKKLFLMILLAALTVPAAGQFSKENFNLVLFGNIHAEYNNANTYGSSPGVYLGWQSRVGSGNWLLGVFTMMDASSNFENLARYNGYSQEYTGGITVGYYYVGPSPEFIGLNLGLKYSKNEGSVNAPAGDYSDSQKDALLYVSGNSTIWWQKFPKTQWQFSYQTPLLSVKQADWNNIPITVNAWDNTYFDFTFKQSLLKVPFIGGNYLYPKIVVVYDYTGGDNEHMYRGGGELSLSYGGHDDWLSVYALYGISHEFEDVASIGLMINFGAL